jgi:anthranilate phosphoribosyltransferase
VGGTAEENASSPAASCSGEIHGPQRDAVLLNAAFALSTECGDLPAGLEEAKQSIDSGAALRMLEAYVKKTQSYGA